jgi:hypothetical protein
MNISLILNENHNMMIFIRKLKNNTKKLVGKNQIN